MHIAGSGACEEGRRVVVRIGCRAAKRHVGERVVNVERAGEHVGAGAMSVLVVECSWASVPIIENVTIPPLHEIAKPTATT